MFEGSIENFLDASKHALRKEAEQLVRDTVRPRCLPPSFASAGIDAESSSSTR